MKKAYLLIVLMAVCATMAFAVEVTHTGRVLMELVHENNWSDFTAWDEDDAPGANDVDNYGKARVDVGFNVMFNENIMAKVAFRGEGNDDGDKWMYFGKNMIDADADGNVDDPGNHLTDAQIALQEAYINFNGLFNQPISMLIGRKAYKYSYNLICDGDKLDGWRLKYDADMFNVAFHYFIRERLGQLAGDEKSNNKTLLGLHAGYDNDMMDLMGYFWMQSQPYDKDEKDADNFFGLRGEFNLMDGMLMPFVEFTMQSGSHFEIDPDDATKTIEIDHAGMLVDLGSKFNMDMGAGKIDAMLQFMMVSGDDVDSDDENEAFTGLGLANYEQGFTSFNVPNGRVHEVVINGEDETLCAGAQMIKLGAGFTPAMMEKLRVGFNFWMFNDNSKNASYLDADGEEVEFSGENMWNEFELNANWQFDKKINMYFKFNYGMPNSDYPKWDETAMNIVSQGEDSAMGITFGTQVKW